MTQQHAVTRVVIIEDDADDAYILQRHLRKCPHLSLEMSLSTTYAGAAASLAGTDCALLDLNLPDLRGLNLVHQITRDFPNLPVVVITGLDDVNMARDVIQAGIQDYIVKGAYDSERLGQTIRYAIERQKLMSQLRDLNGKLERSLEHIETLHGLLPICARCKKIRDGEDYWEEVEVFVAKHADVSFTHGLCPVCYTDVRRELEETSDELKLGHADRHARKPAPSD